MWEVLKDIKVQHETVSSKVISVKILNWWQVLRHLQMSNLCALKHTSFLKCFSMSSFTLHDSSSFWLQILRACTIVNCYSLFKFLQKLSLHLQSLLVSDSRFRNPLLVVSLESDQDLQWGENNFKNVFPSFATFIGVKMKTTIGFGVL